MRYPSSLYLAIGDSITVGLGSSPGKAYPLLVTRSLKKHAPSGCFLSRAAQKGATSKHVLLWTRFSPRVRWFIRHARIISLLIGGNDLLVAYLTFRFSGRSTLLPASVSRYRRNLHQILYQIRRLSPAPVFLLNQYNPFPASALSGTWVGAFNQQTAEVADRWEATLIDLHEWFAGQEPWWIDGYKTGSLDDISLVGPKPIHPNDHGHQAIANALLAAVLGN